jgi:hypothetical protein
MLLALSHCQLSTVCGLTPKRTASGPDVSFRVQQNRHRAAMRFRVEPAVARPAPPQIRT